MNSLVTGMLLTGCDPLGSATKVAIPGMGTFQGIVKSLFVPVLAICVLGILVGVVLWVMGSTGNNPHRSSMGKYTVLIAVVAAVVVGMAPTLISWGNGVGQDITVANAATTTDC